MQEKIRKSTHSTLTKDSAIKTKWKSNIVNYNYKVKFYKNEGQTFIKIEG